MTPESPGTGSDRWMCGLAGTAEGSVRPAPIPSHLLPIVLNVHRGGDEVEEADMRVTDIADTGPMET